MAQASFSCPSGNSPSGVLTPCTHSPLLCRRHLQRGFLTVWGRLKKRRPLCILWARTAGREGEGTGGSAEEGAEGIVDDVVGFGEAQGKAELQDFDAGAEEGGSQRDAEDREQTLPWEQSPGEEPGREEEQNVHQIASQKLLIFPGKEGAIGLKGDQLRRLRHSRSGPVRQRSRRNDSQPNHQQNPHRRLPTARMPKSPPRQGKSPYRAAD